MNLDRGLNKISITIIIALLIIIGVALYFSWQFIFPKPTTDGGVVIGQLPETDDSVTARPITQITDTNVTGQTPRLGTSALADNPVAAFWVNRTNGDIFYFDFDGALYKITNGQEEKLNTAPVNNLHYIKPSTDGAKAIIAAGYPFATTLRIFDAATGNFSALPENTTAAAWKPQADNRVAIIRNAEPTDSIGIYNLATKNYSEITKLNQLDLDLHWATANTLYLFSKPSVEYGSSLWSLNINNRNLTNILDGILGLTIKWTPDGSKMLVFSGDTFGKYFFGLMDNEGEILMGNLPLSLPSKCALGNERAFCAAPLTIPPRAPLPDAYFKGLLETQDNIHQIDFGANYTTTPIFHSLDVIDADQMIYYENSLLFINKRDNRLYKLGLQ